MTIGLSLSFCVRDILAGTVSINTVDKIITGTCAYNVERWTKLINGYAKTYWSAYSRESIDAVIEQLRPKIYQPRTENKPYPMVYKGHWVDSESDIIWSE